MILFAFGVASLRIYGEREEQIDVKHSGQHSNRVSLPSDTSDSSQMPSPLRPHRVYMVDLVILYFRPSVESPYAIQFGPISSTYRVPRTLAQVQRYHSLQYNDKTFDNLQIQSFIWSLLH